MITLYTAATPNGRKISIALEELGLEYQVRPVSLGDNEQNEPWYLKINPNGRIPAIIDHAANELTIFESGAILIYLAEKAGRLLLTNVKERYAVLQWLNFQMAGIGPMQGQVHVFLRYWENRFPDGTARYQRETRRLYGVLDRQLRTRDFIAGDFSIADIALYPWIEEAPWADIDIREFEYLQLWFERMTGMDSVRRGMQVPEDLSEEDVLAVGKAIIN